MSDYKGSLEYKKKISEYITELSGISGVDVGLNDISSLEDIPYIKNKAADKKWQAVRKFSIFLMKKRVVVLMIF